MPKELPSSRDEREQRFDALTNKGAHSQGKVHDFAVRSQTYRYTKDDYFTLRSGERVPRLRGGSEFDDYDDSGGYGGYGDSYDLGTYGSYGRDGGHGGWYGDDEGYRGSYDRGWRGDDEEYRGSYDRIGHRDDEEYRGSYDRGRYGDDGNPSDQWKEHLASTSDKSAWEREQQTKGQDEWLKDERERAREAEEWSKFREENRRDKEAFEPIKQEILELIRQWEMKDEEARQHDGDVHDGGQGGGNGGGDGGNRGVRDGYNSDSDKDARELHEARQAFFDVFNAYTDKRLAEEARAERIEELAKDPAKGGTADSKTRREAEVALQLEEMGQLAGPIRRDPTGDAEFIDRRGTLWDVKQFHSEQGPF